MKLAIDIETNGLLQDVTTIHCLGITGIDVNESKLLIGYDEIGDWFHAIATNPLIELVLHNGFAFDLKVIEKLYGIDFTKTHKVHDTMVLSQILYPNLKDRDFVEFRPPMKYSGSHSLGAWGHRLHVLKGEYDGGWEQYNDEMGKYCLQDTVVTQKLYDRFESEIIDLEKTDFIDIEYAIAPILARQQAMGVEFDKEKAELLEADLVADKARIRGQLQELFKPRVISLGEFTPTVNSVKYGYKKGATFTRIKFEEYNPSSRQQTIDRLMKELGWNPQEFTDLGNPEFDEDIIESLPFPEIKPLKDYYIVNKRLGQLVDGSKSWLKLVKPNNRIYGSLLQSGTMTGRMTHFGPNMAQVPANDKLYGVACRSLFKAGKGKILVGCDADALEMRTLAGYLKVIDGGAFIKTLLEGRKEDGTDMHSLNAAAYEVDQYPRGRDCAKTLFYASLYGAGDAKRGIILQQFGIDLNEYVPNLDKQFKSLKAWSASKGKGWSNKYIECFIAGREAQQKFGDKLPSLSQLIDKVTSRWEERKYLIGLDGRRLYPRKKSAVFNTLNQAAGAIIMKKALQLADNELKLYYTPGKDYEFILNIHDEWQVEFLDIGDEVEDVKKILENSIKLAGEYFKFPCPMKGNAVAGLNWSETH